MAAVTAMEAVVAPVGVKRAAFATRVALAVLAAAMAADVAPIDVQRAAFATRIYRFSR